MHEVTEDQSGIEVGTHTYRSVSDYMAMRDGLEAPEDVTIEASAEHPEPAEPPAAGTPAAPPAAGAVAPVAEAPKPAEPTADDVSKAASTLAQHGQKLSKAQQRQAEIWSQINALTDKKRQTAAEVEADERKRAELQAENERLDREIAQKREAIAAITTPKTAPAAPVPSTAPAAQTAPSAQTPPEPVAPQWEDVEKGTITVEEYQSGIARFVKDHAAWVQTTTTAAAADAARKAAHDALAEERSRQAVVQVERTFEERTRAVKARHPDFEQVAFGDYPLAPDTIPFIKEHEHGPDIAYYLGSHRDEATRIASLPPAYRFAELGRIAATITAGTVASKAGPTSPAPVSPAFIPPSPVGGAPTASQVPLERRSVADYIRERNEAEDRRRGL